MREKPKACFDHVFLSDKGENIEVVSFDEADASIVTCLCGVDQNSGYPFASATPKKGVTSFMVAGLTAWAAKLGVTEIDFQTDDEPSLKALMVKVKAKSEAVKIDLRHSSAYSKASNGAAERVHSTIAGLVRTLTSSVKRRCKIVLRADDRIVTWAVRHAAWLYARFHK